ncbi:hypothetical protein [Tellurirhabdus rosea]|uniref:hypothetical protein n=1 Tax=Tellurirhabdus rosea TaxID=2674997 RepID=UPI00225AF41A|nr:hypothetical protein [Tellurirhabdus rosea]
MKNLQNELTLLERLSAPTPKLFRTIRNLGLIVAAISSTLIGLAQQGINLPPLLDSLASWLGVVAGIIATAVSSLTVDLEAFKKQTALK